MLIDCVALAAELHLQRILENIRYNFKKRRTINVYWHCCTIRELVLECRADGFWQSAGAAGFPAFAMGMGAGGTVKTCT